MEMDKKIKGSWLIHHAGKLQNVTGVHGYENTFQAGKAGMLLSAISADNEITVRRDRLEVLAAAANINRMELPTLLDTLTSAQLIDRSDNEVQVLGVSSSSALIHTANIFESLAPNVNELASIDLAERGSLQPVLAKEISEELSDLYKMASTEIDILCRDSEEIGFVDTEKLGNGDILFFNGNLFRRENTQKITAVLNSLSSSEQLALGEVSALLREKTCVDSVSIANILGAHLFQKVMAIGLFDMNVVSNSSERVAFITLPSAFSKYNSSSMIDDAFDLAKAFISSITYGMTKSSHSRGQIQMVDALLRNLVNGYPVGPVQAIGEDYKILELKGVVEVKDGEKNGRRGPMLRLLKREIGELALQAIQEGDISEHSLLDKLPSSAITRFEGPENNREVIRRRQRTLSPESTNDMLSILRTGGAL